MSRSNNQPVSKEDCSEVLRVYDTSHSHCLYYDDFLRFVLPSTSKQLSSIVLDRSEKSKASLPFQVKKNFLDLLKAELALWRELRPLYEDLRSRPNFGLYHLFQLIDPECNYYLKAKRVHEFMVNQGEKLTIEDINSVLRRLDSDRDGRTSYLDFKYSISGDDEVGTLEEPLVERQKGIYKPLDSPQHKSSTLVGKYAIKSVITSEIVDESFKTPKKNLLEEDTTNERTTTSKKQYKTLIEEYKVKSSGIASRLTSSQSPEVSPLKQDLCSEWEYELAKIFKSQLLIDSELESIKAQLNSQPDFTLSNAFDYFDCKGMKSIALYELKKGLSKLGIKYKDESLMLLMKRYDLDMNGSLNYYEFIKMLSPIIASPLPDVKESATHNDEIEFEETTKGMLIDTFRSLLRTEEIAETIRLKAKGLEVREAFMNCDMNKKGFITKKDLHEFMLRNDMDVKEINGALLMNRYDKDLDEKITMREVM